MSVSNKFLERGYKWIGKFDWGRKRPDFIEDYDQRFFDTYVKREGRNQGKMIVTYEEETILELSQ